MDYEGATSDPDFFRTSLYNYHQVRARATLSGDEFALVPGELPPAGQPESHGRHPVRFPEPGQFAGRLLDARRRQARQRDGGVRPLHAVLQHPTTCSCRSMLRRSRSTATTRTSATSTVDIVLPEIVEGHAPKLTAGGSLFISAGSRATRYYQPLGRLSVPLHKNVQWNTEWR